MIRVDLGTATVSTYLYSHACMPACVPANCVRSFLSDYYTGWAFCVYLPCRAVLWPSASQSAS